MRSLTGWRAVGMVRRRARRILGNGGCPILSALGKGRTAEDEVSTLIDAGSDTLALTWAIYLLSRTPDVRARPVRLRQCVTLQPAGGLWMRVERR